MSTQDKSSFLENIRQALGREGGSPIAPRPPVLPPRASLGMQAEIDLLLKEIQALSGVACRVAENEIQPQLHDLVKTEQVRKACLWPTAGLARLRIAERLQDLEVEIVPPNAGKHTLAQCDLGVTEADFALAETGTLGLLSSPEKPRLVSLLPRVHLAILRPSALRSDLHEVFAEAKGQSYLILVSGPSRTSDIELTQALGVHGPKALYAWVVS